MPHSDRLQRLRDLLVADDEEVPMPHSDRLQRLRDLLVADKNNPQGSKFDLDRWAWPADVPVPTDNVTPLYPYREEVLPKVDCGTYACAIGLAILSGIFEKEGLKANFIDNIFNPGEGGFAIVPSFDGWSGYHATQRFFNLSFNDTLHLFHPDRYDTKYGAAAEQEVIDRIDRIIARDEVGW
jgi:hypothetical protein